MQINSELIAKIDLITDLQVAIKPEKSFGLFFIVETIDFDL